MRGPAILSDVVFLQVCVVVAATAAAMVAATVADEEVRRGAGAEGLVARWWCDGWTAPSCLSDKRDAAFVWDQHEQPALI